MYDQEPSDERYPEYEYRPEDPHFLVLREQPLQLSLLGDGQEGSVLDPDFFL